MSYTTLQCFVSRGQTLMIPVPYDYNDGSTEGVQEEDVYDQKSNIII